MTSVPIPDAAVEAAARVISEVDYPNYEPDLELARKVLEAAVPQLLEQAWDEGADHAWKASGEGWNGEYPGDPFSKDANPYRKGAA